MIDNNEKNLGNKPQGDSYTELEKIIRSSQYSKNKPTDAFRGRLLAELKHLVRVLGLIYGDGIVGVHEV